MVPCRQTGTSLTMNDIELQPEPFVRPVLATGQGSG